MSQGAVDQSNFARYRDPTVVADYADGDTLIDCEEYLFSRYIPPGRDVLDLGVGGGRTTARLARGAASYLGVDYSPEMIDGCRKRFPTLTFSIMDASDMRSLADRSFDAIVFSYNGLGCLSPDTKRQACLVECHRLLRANGVLIFTLHNASSLFVRPGPTTPGSLAPLRSILRAAQISAVRFRHRFFTRAFWRGAGYLQLGVDGGLRLFLARPSRIKSELARTGFTDARVLPNEYPRHASPFITRWYYYVCRKTA